MTSKIPPRVVLRRRAPSLPGPPRHARRRLACAGPLEHVAYIAMPVLDRSAEIGVTGARPRHGWPGIAGLRLRLGRHGVLPIRKVAIGDGERQRGAERVAMPNAACDHGP